MPAYCVYIVRCRDGSLYTGWAADVPKRVRQHNAGKGAKYTRSRRPVTLLYVEKLSSLGAVLRREHHIKALSRAKKLALLQA